jgi:hypothetical protein
MPIIFGNLSEIEHLYTASHFKKDNGYVSQLRESILEASLKGLLTKYEKKSPFISNMNTNLIEVMKTQFGSFPKIKLYAKGGRKYDHDFSLHLFSSKSTTNYTVCKLEYKVVSTYNMSIFDYPQLLSLSTESKSTYKLLHDSSYIHFFYDKYLQNICDMVNVKKPMFDVYAKHAKSTAKSYDIELFQTLQCDYTKYRKEIVMIAKQSIKEFIQTVTIDMQKLFNMFVQRNKNKYILCQSGDAFSIECCDKIFNIDSLLFTGYDKRDDSIIIHTNSKFQIQLLLRWKNKQCCKNPAIDFKLKRCK